MAASGAVSDAGIECHSTVSRLRVYNRVGAGRPIRVVWALEEVGADYELVTITAEEGRSASYRARHPLGRVPVLEDEQGPMFESTTLVFHIAERFPIPPQARAGARDRSRSRRRRRRRGHAQARSLSGPAA